MAHHGETAQEKHSAISCPSHTFPPLLIYWAFPGLSQGPHSLLHYLKVSLATGHQAAHYSLLRMPSLVLVTKVLKGVKKVLQSVSSYRHHWEALKTNWQQCSSTLKEASTDYCYGNNTQHANSYGALKSSCGSFFAGQQYFYENIKAKQRTKEELSPLHYSHGLHADATLLYPKSSARQASEGFCLCRLIRGNM